MIMVMLSSLLLIISFMGLAAFIKERLQIKMEIVPILIFGGISVIMTIGGILNCLAAFAWGIALLGVFLFVYPIITKRQPRIFFSNFANIGIIFFALMAIYLAFVFKDAKLSNYDDFTFWGTVVKTMLVDNQLPTFQDSVIIHQTYPIGSGLFIYFMTYITGIHSEGMMLFSQMLLLLASVTTLFSLITIKDRKQKLAVSIVTAIIGVLIICMGFFVKTLLVDGLLPTVALACVVVSINLRDRLKLNSALCGILMAFLYLIKTSGILFVGLQLFILVSFFVADYKKLSKQERITYFKSTVLPSVIWLCLPFIVMFLWAQHVALVFANPNISTHAISSDLFSQNLHARTFDDINKITELFFAKIMAVDFMGNRILFILHIVTMGILFTMKFSVPKEQQIGDGLFKALIFADAAYVLYMISLWGMYVISMPLSGSLTLSSIARYPITIYVYFIGIVAIAILAQMDKVGFSQNFAKSFILLCTFCACLFSIVSKQGDNIYSNLLKPTAYDGSTKPEYMAEITKDVPVELSTKCLSYIPSAKKDNGYAKFIFRYNTLNANNNIVTSLEDLGEFEQLSAESDILFVFEHDDAIDSYLQEKDYEKIKDDVYVLN